MHRLWSACRAAVAIALANTIANTRTIALANAIAITRTIALADAVSVAVAPSAA